MTATTAEKKTTGKEKITKSKKREIAPAINKPTGVDMSEKKAIAAEFTKCDKEFRKTLKAYGESALSIAEMLFYIEFNKLYTAKGYKSTADYAFVNFGIKKATVSKYLSIVEAFGEQAPVKGYELPYYKLKAEFKSFGWSKLSLMYKAPKALVDKVNSKMSYRQIQNLIDEDKKRAKLEDKNGDDENVVDTTAKIKDIPTMTRQNRFNIRTDKELESFITRLSDPAFLGEIKESLKSGVMFAFDCITVTTTPKVKADK